MAVAVAGLAGGALELAGLHSAASVVLSTLGIAIAVVEAWRMIRDLRSGRWGLDVLAISAVVATIVLGEYWAAFVVTAMIVGGEALEDYASARARRQMSALLSRAPRVAHVLDESGSTHEVAVEEVAVGDQLLVRVGELVPVDARLSEVAELDESSVTGESLPVVRQPGELVASGVIVTVSAVRMVTVAVAADSQYQRIVAMVEAGSSVRGRFVRIADRVAVPFTLLAYAVGITAWVISGDPVRLAQVLVVATPCPLLVAAPTALVAGMGRAARQGLVIKSGETLERFAAIRAAAFDKTGTLTVGRPRVDRVEPETDAVSADTLLGARRIDGDEVVARARRGDRDGGPGPRAPRRGGDRRAGDDGAWPARHMARGRRDGGQVRPRRNSALGGRRARGR